MPKRKRKKRKSTSKTSRRDFFAARHFIEATGETEAYIRAVASGIGLKLPIHRAYVERLLQEIFRRRGISAGWKPHRRVRPGQASNAED